MKTKLKLKLPISGTIQKIVFHSEKGCPLAYSYNRIVIGGRGPYVEFLKDQIIWENFYIPNSELFRINSSSVYYNEYRSIDGAYVKLYEQKQLVKYADYKIGMYYISPYNLYFESGARIIE